MNVSPSRTYAIHYVLSVSTPRAHTHAAVGLVFKAMASTAQVSFCVGKHRPNNRWFLYSFVFSHHFVNLIRDFSRTESQFGNHMVADTARPSQIKMLLLKSYTPYFKMAENTLLFCLIVNWPLLPRSHLQNSKEY